MPRTLRRNRILTDPSLVFYSDFRKDGSVFYSDDAYGHKCTVTGATWNSQGRDFDAVDDVITIANASTLKIDSSFTIGAWWISSATLGINQSQSLIDYFACNPDTGYECFYVMSGSNLTGAVKLSLYDGTNNPTVAGTTDTRDNHWHFAMATRDKGNKLYIDLDGVNQNSSNDTLTGSIVGAGTGTPKIGGDYTNKAAKTMGEVMIFNRALTFAERANLYLATKWRYR